MKYLQNLINDGIYNCKVYTAYCVIDKGDYYSRVNPRKLKRCERYLRKHNISFEALQGVVKAKYNENKRESDKIEKIFTEMIFGTRIPSCVVPEGLKEEK